MADLEAANLRPAIDREGPVQAGLDVSGPGEDETSLYVRCGNDILLQRSWAISDPRGEVIDAIRPYLDRLEEFNVDSNGIGYYIAKHFEDYFKEKLPSRWDGILNYVNVGESPTDKEMYRNLKAELYWRTKLRFGRGQVNGLTDDTTISQLGTVRYRINQKGQVEIESKDDMRKRGAKSPDRAEALILCFADIKATNSSLYPTEKPVDMSKASSWLL
jgi:hypothetical protein